VEEGVAEPCPCLWVVHSGEAEEGAIAAQDGTAYAWARDMDCLAEGCLYSRTCAPVGAVDLSLYSDKVN
jgi:hypothetical protein